MCIKLLSKPLNPRAHPWAPPQKQLPPPPSPSLPPLLPPPPCIYLNPSGAYSHVFAHSRPVCWVYYNPVREINLPKAVAAAETRTHDSETAINVVQRSDSLPRFSRRRKRLGAAAKPSTPPSLKEWLPREAVEAGRLLSEEERGGGSKNTTLMIKNIPNQLRRDFMLKFLDEYCKLYCLEYDFFYLPMDFRRKDNLGYAFVNCTTSMAAQNLKKALQNFKWQMVPAISSKKSCDITWARIQGQKALIERFKDSRFMCDNPEFLPAVFDPPRNGSDPDPSPPVFLGSFGH